MENAMTQSRFTLPESVGRMLALLPAYPGSLLFVSALNLTLKERLPEDVQQSMTGKHFRICVTDAKLGFDFIWTQGGFVAGSNMGEADLNISASAHDFLLLAQRKEDPDTLFFSRRLSMEGDTELGLLVKNTLDAMELNVFELVKAAPLGILAGMRSRLKWPL